MPLLGEKHEDQPQHQRDRDRRPGGDVLVLDRESEHGRRGHVDTCQYQGDLEAAGDVPELVAKVMLS